MMASVDHVVSFTTAQLSSYLGISHKQHNAVFIDSET